MLAQLKKDSVELQAKLDMLKLVLPLEKETDQVLRSVQQAASTSALRILRVGFRPIIDHEVYTEWPIDMEVVGTYHNIGAVSGQDPESSPNRECRRDEASEPCIAGRRRIHIERQCYLRRHDLCLS